eukprot:gene11418-15301_t
MLDFQENENILFKHRAQLKGNLSDGELVVTNLRIAWLSSGSGDLIQEPWVNVVKMKFTAPPHTMVNIKTSVNNKDYTFTLVGPSKEDCRTELEKFKLIESDIKKKKSDSNLANDLPHIHSGNIQTSDEHNKSTNNNKRKVSSLQSTINGYQDSFNDSQLLNQRKKQLLESDRSLAKQYNELVENSKLFTDDEFWMTHNSKLFTSSIANNNNQMILQTGKNNNIMSNIIEKSKDGTMKINLTASSKMDIFMLYPHVKRAFESEVPVKKSEKEFWTEYFRSFHFNNNSNNNSYQPIDNSSSNEPFVRYTDINDLGLVSNGDKKKNLSRFISYDMDLTSSYGDYSTINDGSSNNIIEKDLLPNNNITKSINDDGNSKIAYKCNKNSMIIMGVDLTSNKIKISNLSEKYHSASISDNNNHENNVDLSEELSIKKELNYIPMNLVGYDKTGKEIILESEHKKVASFNHSETTAEFSAFGKATNIVRRVNNNDSNKENQNSEIIQSSEEILLSLDQYYPSSDKAKRIFHNEYNKLSSIPSSQLNKFIQNISSNTSQSNKSEIASFRVPDKYNSVNTIGNDNNDILAPMDEQTDVPNQFKEDMLERFTDVTELLRHFYSILNRKGQSAPSLGNLSADKAQAIINRLSEMGDRLTSRKDKINEDYSNPQRESCVVIIKEILHLILRAKISWDTFIQLPVDI